MKYSVEIERIALLTANEEELLTILKRLILKGWAGGM